jgi:hypothetical protein
VRSEEWISTNLPPKFRQRGQTRCRVAEAAKRVAITGNSETLIVAVARVTNGMSLERTAAYEKQGVANIAFSG